MARIKTDTRFTPPEDDIAKQLRHLQDITRLFRDIAPTLPVSYMQAFLTVCLRPGGGATDYMAENDTIQPVMSRILLHLGPKARRSALGEGGYKLIDTAPDPLDLRRDRYFLTQKGLDLLNKITLELAKIEGKQDVAQ